MNLRILGAAGSETPRYNPPGYLVEEDLLLDAGTAASVLSEDEQAGLRWVLISHAHLDHIKDIPFLADNRLMRGVREPLTIAAPEEVLVVIGRHILNDIIWPDFRRIPEPGRPVLRFQSLVPGQETVLGDYRITPVPVTHSVPAYGYRIVLEGTTLVYSGDTGPTDLLWRLAAGARAMIVEVSFPDEMEALAVESGHLTPMLLEDGLRGVSPPPEKLLVVHAKPAFRDRISDELATRGIGGVLVSSGERYAL